MGACYSDVIRLEKPRGELLRLSRIAGEALAGELQAGHELKAWSQGFELETKMSVRSWGERVFVRVREGAVDVHSRCRMPTQVMDWGKNRHNVSRFIALFNEAAGRGLASGGLSLSPWGGEEGEGALSEVEEP